MAMPKINWHPFILASLFIFSLSCETKEKNSNSSSSGPRTAGPACGSSLPFTIEPINMASISGIYPLGNLATPSHVFPTDHTYMYLVSGSTTSANVVAPGDVTITYVTSVLHQWNNSTPPYTDYTLSMSPCAELLIYFGHMQSLSASLTSAIGAINENCTNYSTGGQTVTSCSKSVNISVSAGTLIGTAGGNVYQVAMDVGAYDTRITPIAFANPSRFSTSSSKLDTFHTVCPYDYFTAGPAALLTAKLGNASGTIQRTASPLCNSIAADVAGTAAGRWFKPGQPNSPEDPHLTLTYHPVDPTDAVFSVGTAWSGLSTNVYAFPVATSGMVNRRFEDITVDGQRYCYDSFSNLSGSILILQLTNSTTVRVEKQTAVNCGPGPWNFTGSYVDYVR